MKRGIEVHHLTKEYPGTDVPAVHQVTFAVAPGEVVGLLGANGAGKTTIMKVLATLLRPTAGTVRVDGFNTVGASRAVRSRVGMLFGSDSGLYERLSGRENIRYFADLHGVETGTREVRFSRLADLFGLHSFADRLVATCSTGMKQRIALARSVIHDPPVLILDEPTNALDIATTTVVHQFISLSRNEGKAVILSSHDTTELENLCDRVLLIDAGTIVDDARRGRDFGRSTGLLRERLLAMDGLCR